MLLTDTYILPKIAQYANPENTTDSLPSLYGDLTQGSAFGVIHAPCIDTVNFWYGLSAFPITDTAPSVYIDDVLVTNYTFYSSTNLEDHGLIAAIQFTEKPTGSVTFRAIGKMPPLAGSRAMRRPFLPHGHITYRPPAPPGGDGSDNPIAILEDILTVMGYTGLRDDASFVRAKAIAETLGLHVAGAITSDQPLIFWIKQLLASFLGDVWLNADKELVVSLDTIATTIGPIRGFLNQKFYDSPSVHRSVENLCNTPVVSYAPNYSGVDRRTTTNTTKNDFDGYDDGTTVQDAISVQQFGVCQKSFEWYWIRDSTVMRSIQTRIVQLFANPIWIFTVTELQPNNFFVGRGDLVVASNPLLRDAAQQPIFHQIWKVLEIDKPLMALTPQFVLQDTGYTYSSPPIYYNGMVHIGDYTGRHADTEEFY